MEALLALDKVFERTLAMYQPDVPVPDLTPGTHLNEWNWTSGIAHYGLLKTHHLVFAETQLRYFDFVREWFVKYLDRSEPTATLNGALLTNVLWQLSQDPKIPFSNEERQQYTNYCFERAIFYRDNALRLPSGVFGHSVAGIPESGKQVWADNLFMLVLFLAKMSGTLPDLSLNQMEQQVALHFIHLTDPQTKLLYHVWQDDPHGLERDLLENSGTHFNGALWGRGAGWAAIALAEMSEIPHYPALPCPYFTRPFFQSLLNNQRVDGKWNTLLYGVDTYPETSATACFAATFFKGYRLGWLEEDYYKAAKLAINALLDYLILEDGTVQGVSGSTPVFPTREDYTRVPYMPVCTWGQGMALLALGEYLS
jgi:unsaturated rhamnogalacturonyl hydrolase